MGEFMEVGAAGTRSACSGGVERVVCCLMNRAKVCCRGSINQVHQKRIRSVSVRRCGPIHGGGQAEEQHGQGGEEGSEDEGGGVMVNNNSTQFYQRNQFD